jgi:hypothetical protein
MGSAQNRLTELICILWRKALQCIWKLTVQTHSDILYCLCNGWSVEDELFRCSLLFIHRCINSDSYVVKYIVSFVTSHASMRSTMGRNIYNKYTCNRFNYFQFHMY